MKKITIIKKLEGKKVYAAMDYVKRLVEKVFLVAIYIVGIGLASIISRFFGKKYLNINPVKTNWNKPTGSNNHRKMY